MLKTVIEKVRFYLDEIAVDAKFEDDFIVRYFVCEAVQQVIARLNLSADDPIVIRHQIDLEVGRQYYQLPPNLQEVWRLTIFDDETGSITADSYPRGEFNPMGPGWSIEGNMLSIRPFPTEELTCQLFYVPTGDVGIHYHSGTSSLGAVGSDNLTFTLATSPTLGVYDRRPEAYAGMILRVLPPNGVWQERIIATHSTNTVVVRQAFSPTLASTVSIPYEIAPVWSQALYSAIALAVAMNMAVGRNVSQVKMQYLQTQYKIAMKTAKDAVGFRQMRTGKSFLRETIDNPDTKWGWGWGRMSQVTTRF